METIDALSVIASQTSPRQWRLGAFKGRHGMTNRFATAASAGAIRRWCPPAIALAILAALSPLTTSPAGAQAKKAAPARPAQPTESTAPRQAGEAIMAIVSIKS